MDRNNVIFTDELSFTVRPIHYVRESGEKKEHDSEYLI